MRLRTLPNVRLVCTLHCSSLMRAGIGAKPDEYMRGLRAVSNPGAHACGETHTGELFQINWVEQAFHLNVIAGQSPVH